MHLPSCLYAAANGHAGICRRAHGAARETHRIVAALCPSAFCRSIRPIAGGWPGGPEAHTTMMRALRRGISRRVEPTMVSAQVFKLVNCVLWSDRTMAASALCQTRVAPPYFTAFLASHLMAVFGLKLAPPLMGISRGRAGGSIHLSVEDQTNSHYRVAVATVSAAPHASFGKLAHHMRKHAPTMGTAYSCGGASCSADLPLYSASEADTKVSSTSTRAAMHIRRSRFCIEGAWGCMYDCERGRPQLEVALLRRRRSSCTKIAPCVARVTAIEMTSVRGSLITWFRGSRIGRLAVLRY